MNFSELVSKVFTGEDLSLIQGIEKKLRSRRRRERNGIYLSVAALIFGVVGQLAGAEVFKWDHVINFWDFIILVVKGYWIVASLYSPVWEPLIIVVIWISLLFYFLITRNSFLQVESEEPFRYTFWVNPFIQVADTPPKDLFTLDRCDRLKLLHHDLMERLNSRIKRLSLLKLDELTSENSKTDPSYFEPARDLQSKLVAHILIGGDYSIREEKDNEWVIHVMPTVRIGSFGNPSILGYSVKFPLEKDNKLTADQYNQFIERVYSSVATELYRQIELDVQEKMKLFPSSRLRAVALFNEAKDFARSNTIDAYDRAINLYREALRYFEISQIRPVTDFLIKRDFFWRFKAKPVYLQAQIQIGYIKCLVYRRIVSALTGRYSNPLFEIRPIINEMIDRLPHLHDHFGRRGSDPLLTFFVFPKDSWVRHKLRAVWPSESSFEKRSHILFDAYMVAALGYFYLGSFRKAPDLLNIAKSINPKLSDRNPIFLMTAGLIEADLDESILLLRQATETAPDFQIAQYLLAERSEKLFRMKNEITTSRVVSVIREYDKVLNINPGNVAALAAQGYLWWLVGDLKSAKKKFEEGSELKSIAADTFVGQLTYGLARIAAEEGRFNDAYDLFHQAISADPGIATYFSQNVNLTFYSQMVPKILGRYQYFKDRVKNHHRRKMRGSINFEVKDLKDPIGIAVKFKYAKDDKHDLSLKDDDNVANTEGDKNARHGENDKNAIYIFIIEKFSGKTKKLLDELDDCREPSSELSIALPEELNRILKCKTFYQKDRFKDVILSQEAHRLIRQNPTGEDLYGLNRLLLEEIFPDELIRHEDVYENVRDAVFSYALNDYGNACLGYYARLGELRRHELAIKIFDKAFRLNVENVVVRFNQYIAYTWKRGVNNLSDSFGYIQDVLVKYPNQKVIVFTLAQSILREPEEIREKKKEIEEYKRRTSVTVKPEKPEKQEDATDKVRAIGGADKKPLSELIKEREALEESWSKSVEKVKYLSINNSKFSSLLDASRTNSGAVLGKLKHLLASSKIISEKLNEHDVNALKVLCQYLLMSKDRSKIDIQEIESIFYRILDLFWPEDFDIDNILERHKSILNAFTIERRKSRVNYWLRQDPVHCFNLDWLEPKYFGNGITEDIRTRMDHAEREVRRLKLKNPNYWTQLANMYYRFGNYKEAIKFYTEATMLDKGNSFYYNYLGNAFHNNRNYEKASENYEVAIAINSEYAVYHANLIDALGKAGSLEKSKASFEAVLKKKPNDAIFLHELGNALYQNQQWEKAVKSFESAIALNENNPDYRNSLGDVYYAKGDYDKSCEQYDKAISIKQDDPLYHTNLARAYSAKGNWVKAIEAFGKASSLVPQNAANVNDLGDAYYNSGNYEKASENFKKAIEFDSDVAAYHANLIIALEKSKKKADVKQSNVLYKKVLAKYKKALANANLTDKEDVRQSNYLDKALRQDIADYVFLYEFGNAFYQKDQCEKAIELFSAAIELNSNDAAYFNSLGNAYYNKRDFEKASENYTKAKDIRQDVAAYHHNLGLAYYESSKWPDAIEAITKATKKDEGNALYFNDLGSAYYASKDYKTALANFEKAKSLRPDVAVHYTNIGHASLALYDWESAIEAFGKATEWAPGNATNFKYLGDAYYNRGLKIVHDNMLDYNKAAEQYLKAFEKDRKDAYAQNLIEVSRLIGTPPAYDTSYIKKALKIDPDNRYLKDELGKG